MAIDEEPTSDPNTTRGTYEHAPEIILSFEEEIRWVINKCSKESGSDTPDMILAEYLNDCLNVFDKAVRARDVWHSHEPWGDESASLQNSTNENVNNEEPA